MTPREDPLSAIRKLTEAWVAKDAAEMARWLDDDVVEIGPTFRAPLEGKPDFFRKYRQYLTGPLQVVRYTILRPRIVPLSAGLLLVHFSYRMRTRLLGRIEDSRGKESMLLVRKGRSWRVRLIHWHRDPE